MQFKKPAYPQELTDAWWQRKKGVIAKIATKDDGTGIGKKLDDLEKAWKRIDWDGLNPDRAPGVLGRRTPEQVQEIVSRGRNAAQRIQPVYKLAVDLEVDANRLAGEWSRKRTIPKTSTAAAQTIAQKARDLSFQISLGTLASLVEKNVKEEAAEAVRVRNHLAALLADVPSKLDTLIEKLGKGVAFDEWADLWRQDIRHIGTQLPKLVKLQPAIAADVAEYRKHSNKCNTPKDQQEVDRWVQHLSTHATALRRQLG